MKLRYRFAAYVFCAGLLCVALLTAFYAVENRRASLAAAGESSHGIADQAARALDVLLREKSRKALALTHNEGFVRALMESNHQFSLLSEERRATAIDSLNDQWVSTHDPGDAFIRHYTHNSLATFLRNHMASMDGEYGEIFLTDRYGVLVASTGKLTTLKHAHKYWWQAAHHDGAGRVFLDDRGYDTSVGDYVLGVVVPVRHDGEIIGILKSNINVIGPIGDTIRGFGCIYEGTLSLVRSGGLIVCQEGVEPLASELDTALTTDIRRDSGGDEEFWFDTPDSVFAYSTVQVSEGSQDFGFGGSHESIDHIKGNEGEEWLILAEIDKSTALQTARSTSRTLFSTGVATVLILAAIAYLFGNRMSKPVIRMVSQRTRELEKALQEVKTLQGIIPICAYCKKIRNDEGAWEQLEGYFATHTDSLFSHGICPECHKKLMDETDQ